MFSFIYKFHARQNVSPLVRSTDLNGTPMGSVQLVKVVTLQELIGELGEGDTLLSTHSRLHTAGTKLEG